MNVEKDNTKMKYSANQTESTSEASRGNIYGQIQNLY